MAPSMYRCKQISVITKVKEIFYLYTFVIFDLLFFFFFVRGSCERHADNVSTRYRIPNRKNNFFQCLSLSSVSSYRRNFLGRIPRVLFTIARFLGELRSVARQEAQGDVENDEGEHHEGQGEVDGRGEKRSG